MVTKVTYAELRDLLPEIARLAAKGDPIMWMTRTGDDRSVTLVQAPDPVGTLEVEDIEDLRRLKAAGLVTLGSGPLGGEFKVTAKGRGH